MKKKVLNVILLNVTVFFALISIHEISHLVIGSSLGCEYGKAVLMDTVFNGPYAELVCTNGINQSILYLSSLFLTSCFGLLFLSLNSPGKNMFFVILGLSLVFSSFDIGMAMNMSSIIYPVIGSGFILMIIGEYFIASSYLKEDILLDFFGMREIEEAL